MSLNSKSTHKKASQKASQKASIGHLNTGSSVEEIKASIVNHIRLTLAHGIKMATKTDWWIATCLAVRDRALDRAFKTWQCHHTQKPKRLYYLSLEYLMGRLLENNLRNSHLFEATKQALAELGQDLEEIINQEPDMGLGNGGLGRLAACFLDSLATLDLPSVGYGIHYEFGLFKQSFSGGQQTEAPDAWTRFGNPWKIIRPEYSQKVQLYGHVETQFNDKGEGRPAWVNTKTLIGVPWDIPIIGYDSETVNFLRLWESHASEEFNLHVFNEGGYVDAVHDKVLGETVSKVLYPNDQTESGKELRLVQQYFFCCCSLYDLIRRFEREHDSWDLFPEKVAIQLNDTHPAVAIPELMRILIDEKDFDWDSAWKLCNQVFAYTNHTLLPEALEKWSVPLFEKVLPRHLQIIYQINAQFMELVEAKWPGDDAKKAELSMIEEGYPKKIRMALLSVIGSHTTNGVAALHSRLITEKLFPLQYELFPERFQNKTNGITPRRWLKCCNPDLSALIDSKIGSDWPKDLGRLTSLEKWAKDSAFQKKFLEIKRNNKLELARVIEAELGIHVSADALFDVQIKRLHEYKRQHLNLLYILTLYRRILQNPDLDVTPRVFIFAAKAAPGYYLAKNIIYAINAVAAKINQDPRIQGKLKVAFLPNYGVSLAEKIIPAADLSEQISTAGKEASGTGNMKLALNGALTIGTLDGANVEICEEVGDDNIYIFGLTVEEVDALRAKGYQPYDYYWANDELRTVIDWLSSDYFTGNAQDFQPLRHSLLDGGDPFMVLADYADYIATQDRVGEEFKDRAAWAEKAILNTARVGKFSSDRTIQEYADEIWNLKPVRPSDFASA